MKWILRIERRMPGYLVRKELQRNKLREKAGEKVWKFEERLEEKKGSDIAKKIFGENERKCRKGRIKYQSGRRKEKNFLQVGG